MYTFDLNILKKSKKTIIDNFLRHLLMFLCVNQTFPHMFFQSARHAKWHLAKPTLK